MPTRRFCLNKKDCTSRSHNDSSRRSVEATDLFAHAPRPDSIEHDELLSRHLEKHRCMQTVWVRHHISYSTDNKLLALIVFCTCTVLQSVLSATESLFREVESTRKLS